MDNLDVRKKVDFRLLYNLKMLAKFLEEDENPLSLDIANALIGKYVYIRYLKDRKIFLTPG